MTALAAAGCAPQTPSPPDALVTIGFDARTNQPTVDKQTVTGYKGAAVRWRSGLGEDTAWVVRMIDYSPFRDDQMDFESRPNNPAAPVGGVIRRTIRDGTRYTYAVKLIVNGGQDTLGADPDIMVRDPD